MTADVNVTDESIILSRISTPYRGGVIVAELAPLEFDRRQYNGAIEQLLRDIEAWKIRRANQGSIFRDPVDEP